MNYLYVIYALIVVILAYMWFEASMVKVERVRFTKSKDYLKIIHLSDIHINLLRVSPIKMGKIIEDENPDLIILSGDYIEKPSDVPEFIQFLEYIIGRHNVYFTLGNHDYRAFKNDKQKLSTFIKQIEEKGLISLENQSQCFEKNNKKYNIIGISDMRYGHHDIAKALKSCCSNAFTNIAFTHNPDLILEMSSGVADYLLCGHFHGGQIWAPFHFEFKILRKEKLCRMGIRRGLHKLNGINLYISRGLGNVIFPFRFFSRPEITVFYLP